MSEEWIRSFIAIEVSNDDVKRCIVRFQKAILSTNADLKLVNADNMHITLRFLGDITPTMIEKVSEELKTIRFPPFEVEFRAVGVFPSLKRINVVWVGIKKGVTELIDLSSQINSRLTKTGFPPETRVFRPHITVARVRSSRNKIKLANMIIDMQNNVFGSLIIDSIKLKKSILMPNGPLYSTLLNVKGIKN
jgi:2'-5' RNA ligase